MVGTGWRHAIPGYGNSWRPEVRDAESRLTIRRQIMHGGMAVRGEPHLWQYLGKPQLATSIDERSGCQPQPAASIDEKNIYQTLMFYMTLVRHVSKSILSKNNGFRPKTHVFVRCWDWCWDYCFRMHFSISSTAASIYGKDTCQTLMFYLTLVRHVRTCILSKICPKTHVLGSILLMLELMLGLMIPDLLLSCQVTVWTQT